MENNVIARLKPEDKFTTYIDAKGHEIIADEPEEYGGDNKGPDPYSLLASALASCTVMTMRLYSKRKNWEIKEFKTTITHIKDYAKDCEECEKPGTKIDVFERIIEVNGDITDEIKLKLVDIANKCPVHKTLNSQFTINTKFKD